MVYITSIVYKLLSGFFIINLHVLRHVFVFYDMDASVFDNKFNLVILLLKSFTINAPLSIRLAGIISIDTLQDVINNCDGLQ